MGLKAGKLRHRITIQVNNPTKDANGQPIDQWTPIGLNPIVWAAIEPTQSSKTFTSQVQLSEATHKITIRYRGDLSAVYRFTYADPGTGATRIFNLLGIPRSPDEKREFLECEVAERLRLALEGRRNKAQGKALRTLGAQPRTLGEPMPGFAITGRIEGIPEITKLLKGLPDRMARHIIKPALVKACKPVLADAKQHALAIADTGELAESLDLKAKTYSASNTIVVMIGPRTGRTMLLTRRGRKSPTRVNPAYYAHLVEFGTKPHRLARRLKNFAHLSKTLGGMHPGTKANPFLRPALEGNKEKVASVFAAEVEKRLAKLLKKERANNWG